MCLGRECAKLGLVACGYNACRCSLTNAEMGFFVLFFNWFLKIIYIGSTDMIRRPAAAVSSCTRSCAPISFSARPGRACHLPHIVPRAQNVLRSQMGISVSHFYYRDSAKMLPRKSHLALEILLNRRMLQQFGNIPRGAPSVPSRSTGLARLRPVSRYCQWAPTADGKE